jgi:hypothetical protein
MGRSNNHIATHSDELRHASLDLSVSSAVDLLEEASEVSSACLEQALNYNLPNQNGLAVSALLGCAYKNNTTAYTKWDVYEIDPVTDTEQALCGLIQGASVTHVQVTGVLTCALTSDPGAVVNVNAMLGFSAFLSATSEPTDLYLNTDQLFCSEYLGGQNRQSSAVSLVAANLTVTQLADPAPPSASPTPTPWPSRGVCLPLSLSFSLSLSLDSLSLSLSLPHSQQSQQQQQQQQPQPQSLSSLSLSL